MRRALARKGLATRAEGERLYVAGRERLRGLYRVCAAGRDGLAGAGRRMFWPLRASGDTAGRAAELAYCARVEREIRERIEGPDWGVAAACGSRDRRHHKGQRRHRGDALRAKAKAATTYR